MTKVTILGKAEAAEPAKKKIEFVRCIESGGGTSNPITPVEHWANIILLSMDWQTTGLDLMFAYNSMQTGYGCLYLGHFNDGVV